MAEPDADFAIPVFLFSLKGQMPPILVLFVSNDADACAGHMHGVESTGNIRVVGESRVGPEAIDLVGALKPDVIVVDVSDDAVETFSFFTSVHVARPQVRIIALVDHESSAFALKALDSGVLGYLTHREAAHELADAITTVTQGQVYLCPSASGALVEGYRRQARARQTTPHRGA